MRKEPAKDTMKKILLLLSIMLLGGCQMGTQEKEDYLYFLFATPLAEHDIWLQAKEGFDDACEAIGSDLR